MLSIIYYNINNRPSKKSTNFSLLKTYGVWGDESCNSNTESFNNDSISLDTIIIQVLEKSNIVSDTIFFE